MYAINTWFMHVRDYSYLCDEWHVYRDAHFECVQRFHKPVYGSAQWNDNDHRRWNDTGWRIFRDTKLRRCALESNLRFLGAGGLWQQRANIYGRLRRRGERRNAIER